MDPSALAALLGPPSPPDSSNALSANILRAIADHIQGTPPDAKNMDLGESPLEKKAESKKSPSPKSSASAKKPSPSKKASSK